MKVSLWNQIVRPPSTTTSARLTQSMVSTFLRRSLSTSTWASVAKITTTVASNTGASPGPTAPPETRKPKCSEAKAAAASLSLPANLNAAKNRMIGRKSASSFIAFAV